MNRTVSTVGRRVTALRSLLSVELGRIVHQDECLSAVLTELDEKLLREEQASEQRRTS